jgi:hypothetical protein
MNMEMEKALPAVMGAMFGLAMIVAVAGMAQGMVPTPKYTCPICGIGFSTYEELYSHFTQSHPSEPITIIWE